MRLSIFLVLISLGTSLSARDTKEQKRQHTYNLRRWLQLLEFTVDDRLDAERHQQRVSEMDALFDKIKGKLSKKKQDRFVKAYAAYRAKGKPSPSLKADFLKLRQLTFELYRMVTSPARIPDQAHGERLYREQCASCHGATGGGDGRFTKNPALPMIPPPKDLRKQFQESVRSPYSYFNTILIGSSGTAMSSYQKTLKAHDIWSLAFFMSEGFSNKKPKAPAKNPNLSLNDLSILTNNELIDKVNKTGEQGDIHYVRSIMSYKPSVLRRK
ncbi:c-type cytochrome [Pseudobacteriovorax antillogorgiicola]|uniref:Cytochrome c, mono-and diheme variants n=1 Tax=Pseudobacteriovorax antillogorgiicola TaxID=1513793 RepID=A0A1Y6B3H5_9BACT|nr:cytochrome c [Pseudobacteriovorax antillogorgiicola]TCS59307.1 mono/diheme cytochrome c family protein [Pseudobacteriovorax antillogorgiicola]SME89554.1 Cytochrome c, mono-and diheme variants [Pseudobacteriovorax antillogorgiicola]